MLKDLLSYVDMTLAVAESLTAGKLSDLIAKNRGISEFYLGGITSYTCDIKYKVLGVSRDMLYSKGPYNFETTHQMCDGVMKLMGSDIAVATSGVAGPGDDLGTPQGVAYITVKINGKYVDFLFQSTKQTREEIRQEVAEMAYHLLISELVKIKMGVSA